PISARGYGLKVRRNNRFRLFPLPYPLRRIFRVVGTFNTSRPSRYLRLKLDPALWVVFALLLPIFGGVVTCLIVTDSHGTALPFLFVALILCLYLVWDLRNAIVLMDEVEDLIGKREEWRRIENRDDHP
ncbi:MAG: hypothetical protein KC940_16580, partial [Candidatus Omnitrophica bacterium]|nr:hypothetical protein [Candidatus Omnitrophota bacterium]